MWRIFWLAAMITRLTSALAPTHLIVLQHGLSGTALDLSYLAERIEALAASRGARVRVHSAVRNVGRTLDGVAAGGARLAARFHTPRLCLLVSYTASSRAGFCASGVVGGLFARPRTSTTAFWASALG